MNLEPLRPPRQELGVGTVGGLVYVVGGILENRSATARADRYDPVSNTWERIDDIPLALHHPNVAGLEGRLFVLGGLDGGFQGVSDCFAFDPLTGDWEGIASMPTRRGASATAVLGGRVFVAGGQRGGTTVAEHAAYTPGPDGGSWEELPPMPTARNHLGGAAVSGFFFALSGRASQLRAEVERYDPVARAWSSRAPIPTPRGGVAAAAIGSSIWVFGGEGNPDEPSGIFPQTERYDVEADRWEARPPMSVPRHGIGAAIIGDTIFIPGGADQEGYSATAAHTAFAPRAEDLPGFLRGDIVRDGSMDISDAVRILNRLFLSAPEIPCLDAADANDDGKVDISDPVRILGHLFLGDASLPPPFGAPGGDPTPDFLDCSG